MAESGLGARHGRRGVDVKLAAWRPPCAAMIRAAPGNAVPIRYRASGRGTTMRAVRIRAVPRRRQADTTSNGVIHVVAQKATVAGRGTRAGFVAGLWSAAARYGARSGQGRTSEACARPQGCGG